jgi:hypothetical protein
MPPSKSINDAILASKRAAQGAGSAKLSIDDVNYLARNPSGPDSSHRSINDMWLNRWTSNAPKKTINDGMYGWYGGSAATMAAHKSVSDLLAEYFHAAGYP